LPLGDHRVQAALKGHQDSQRTVTLTRAGERVVVELALAPLPQTPAVSRANPLPRPAEALGKLTLKTTPWTTVCLGKQKLGDTPLIEVPVPSGKRVLRMVNPEKSLESAIEVEIVPGQTTVKTLRLEVGCRPFGRALTLRF
jgi:serine/threonine-protein kinase